MECKGCVQPFIGNPPQCCEASLPYEILWGVYTIQQTSSKLPANVMLDVCWIVQTPYYSVTCHLTQVNAPRFNPSQTGWFLMCVFPRNTTAFQVNSVFYSLRNAKMNMYFHAEYYNIVLKN